MHDSARALDPTETSREIRQFGSSVVRGMWNVELLRKLRAAIATHIESRARRVAQTALPLERMYSTHGIGMFAAVVDEGLLRKEFLLEMFLGSYYQDVCSTFFGSSGLFVNMSRLAFRSHDPSTSDRSFIPYHQDSYTQDPRIGYVLNCWMPLDEGAGRVSPGLEVVRNPCTPNFPRKALGLKSENAAYDFIAIERDKIIAAYGANFLAPEFNVGDGLIFSQDVIHRTYVTSTMTKPRINFEFRVFSASGLAPGVQLSDLGPDVMQLC